MQMNADRLQRQKVVAVVLISRSPKPPRHRREQPQTATIREDISPANAMLVLASLTSDQSFTVACVNLTVVGVPGNHWCTTVAIAWSQSGVVPVRTGLERLNHCQNHWAK